MKHSIWLLLLVLLSGPGCMNMPKLVWDEPPPKQKAVEPAPAPPPPPPIVQPDDVNESNFGQQTERLRAEMDYEDTRRLPSQPIIHTVDGGNRP